MRGRQRRNSLLQRHIVHCKGEEGEWSCHSRCMPLHCSGTLTHIHKCCLQFFSFSLSRIIGIFIELVLAEKLLNYWSIARVDGLCCCMSADSCCVASFDRDANQQQI